MNANYKKITELGYQLVVKANRCGWFRLYAVKDNTKYFTVFRQNWEDKQTAQSRLEIAIKDSHKDTAMNELLTIIKENEATNAAA